MEDYIHTAQTQPSTAHASSVSTAPQAERVLCFPRITLQDLGLFQGLSLEVSKYLPTLLSPAQLLYIDRPEAERNKNYKQVIPYMLLVCGGKILRYRRGASGGEARLHGFRSVGIGGHICEEDNGIVSYGAAMWRELKEETGLNYVGGADPVALLNDETTEVGSVHFGIVHIVRVPDETVAGQCHDIATPEFIPRAEAKKDIQEYEGWSQFCLQNIDAMLYD